MKKLKPIFTFLIANRKCCIGLALVSFFLPLTNSCHKYPNDPFISLERPEKRIQGKYKLAHLYVNGVDSVNNSKYFYYSSNYHIEVPKRNLALYKSDVHFFYDVDMGSYVAREDCSVSFRNEQKSLYIPRTSFLILTNTAMLWDINKLTSNELFISTTINGNYYEIHLKK